MSVTKLIRHVDDFWKQQSPHSQSLRMGQRRRARQLCESEIMNLLILFHQSHYRTLQGVLHGVCVPVSARGVPRLGELHALRGVHSDCAATYGIAWAPAPASPLWMPLHWRYATTGGSGSIRCSVGWVFGFKLHLVTNDRGELLNITLTPGNTDDRTPVPALVRHLFGKLLADKVTSLRRSSNSSWRRSACNSSPASRRT